MRDIVTIAIDAMGGDHGPSVTVPASLQAIKDNARLRLILVGLEDELKAEFARQGAEPSERLSIHHASQQVDMCELPSVAMRSKKDSSMRVAINLVKKGEAQACVSAGNTGALMATARFVLKMLPGIDRPAIIASMPTTKGHTHVLDLGANVDSSAENLFEFAVMGSVLVSAVDGIANPSVALLNIGEEEIKGNEQVKGASLLLAESDLNYIGYIEGDGIFKGEADVVVCDGFVGNVSLKTTEGVAKMMGYYLKDAFNKNIFTKVAALIAMPVINAFRHKFDPGRYNGASFVGLRAIVVKSHGGADVPSYKNAIHEAIKEVDMDVPMRISEQLEAIFSRRQAK